MPADLISGPDFVGSTAILLEDRLSTFLEIVPLHLAYLKIKQVMLANHSAGTIYVLNLLAQQHLLLSLKDLILSYLARGFTSPTGLSPS